MAPVYVLDACVLYPVVVRDLLLTLATLDAFEPRWTAAIIDEMTRNVLADRPGIDAVQFDARSVGAMRRAFPDASIEGYEHLIDRMDNHPKDRHVAAAAVHVGAAAVLTYDLRDFKSELFRQRGIAIVTPRQLVDALVDDEPSVVALAVRSMVARKKRPPTSPTDVVAAIVRQQVFGPLENSLRTLVEWRTRRRDEEADVMTGERFEELAKVLVQLHRPTRSTYGEAPRRRRCVRPQVCSASRRNRRRGRASTS